MKLDLRNFKAVIFDMDGTMVDNTPFHKKAWIEFSKKYGIALTEEGFHQKISGKRNDAIFEILFGRKIEGQEYKKLDEEKEALYRELYKPHIKEIKGLSNLLQYLKAQGLKVGIATTSPFHNRMLVLKNLGLMDFFEVIVGGEDTKHGKPHPEIYLTTAEKLGINPTQCLAFEDTPSGVKSAKSAGMVVVGVLTAHTKEELKEVDHFIKDFSEIEIQK